MRRLLRVSSFAVALACLGTGCPSRPKSEQALNPDVATSPLVKDVKREQPVEIGAIQGRVILASNAKLPHLSPSQYLATTDTTRLTLSDTCKPISDSDLKPVHHMAQGLSPVLVTVTGYKRAPHAKASKHVMHIRDCRIEPGLLVAMRGDTVSLTNDSKVPFLPQFRGDAFLQAVIPNQTRDVLLKTAGVQRLGCAFGERCGGAYLVVLGHPVSDVTDQQGQFHMDNVPANQKLILHVWHPLFTEVKRIIEVTPGQTQHMEDIVLYPSKESDTKNPKVKR